MSNVHTNPWAPPSWNAPAERERLTDALTSAVLAAVEGQLTAYVEGVAKQLAEERAVAAEGQARLRDELSGLLETRLAELATARRDDRVAADARLASVEQRIDTVPSGLDGRIDELSARLESQLGTISQQLEQPMAAVRHEVASLRSVLAAVEQHSAAIDLRVGSVEERVDALHSHVGSVQDRIGTVESRIGSFEDRVRSFEHRLDEFVASVSGIDQDAIEQLKQEMSRAVGEATLVRIEIDRLSATSSERFDKVTVRMGEIEAKLTDDTDVSAAVQLERLDEFERALAEIDPNQFVRKDGSDSYVEQQQTDPSPSAY